MKTFIYRLHVYTQGGKNLSAHKHPSFSSTRQTSPIKAYTHARGREGPEREITFAKCTQARGCHGALFIRTLSNRFYKLSHTYVRTRISISFRAAAAARVRAQNTSTMRPRFAVQKWTLALARPLSAGFALPPLQHSSFHLVFSLYFWCSTGVRMCVLRASVHSFRQRAAAAAAATATRHSARKANKARQPKEAGSPGKMEKRGKSNNERGIKELDKEEIRNEASCGWARSGKVTREEIRKGARVYTHVCVYIFFKKKGSQFLLR